MEERSTAKAPRFRAVYIPSEEHKRLKDETAQTGMKMFRRVMDLMAKGRAAEGDRHGTHDQS